MIVNSHRHIFRTLYVLNFLILLNREVKQKWTRWFEGSWISRKLFFGCFGSKIISNFSFLILEKLDTAQVVCEWLSLLLIMIWILRFNELRFFDFYLDGKQCLVIFGVYYLFWLSRSASIASIIAIQIL